MGPGHAGILRDPTDGRYAFTFDYMAIDQEDHVFKTQARELVWLLPVLRQAPDQNKKLPDLQRHGR